MTQMPTIGEYRAVALHAFQSQQRIDEIVKPAIDFVYGVSDPKELLDYASSPAGPPEARILAAARLTAISEQRADKRLPLPGLDPIGIKAAVAGLASHWASRTHYCVLFDPHDEKAAPRPPEFGRQLDEYFSNAARGVSGAGGHHTSSL